MTCDVSDLIPWHTDKHILLRAPIKVNGDSASRIVGRVKMTLWDGNVVISSFTRTR